MQQSAPGPDGRLPVQPLGSALAAPWRYIAAGAAVAGLLALLGAAWLAPTRVISLDANLGWRESSPLPFIIAMVIAGAAFGAALGYLRARHTGLYSLERGLGNGAGASVAAVVAFGLTFGLLLADAALALVVALFVAAPAIMLGALGGFLVAALTSWRAGRGARASSGAHQERSAT